MYFVKLTAFTLGLVLAVAGYFLDRADDYPVVIAFIAPDAVAASRAVSLVTSARQFSSISVQEEGVAELLDFWPGNPPTPIVVAIWRGPASTIFGSEVSNDVPLALLADENQRVQGSEWSLSGARSTLDAAIHQGVLRIGGWLFAFGLCLSAAVGLWEFWRDRPGTPENAA